MNTHLKGWVFILLRYEKSPFGLIDLNGDSLGARTPDPLIKSQMRIYEIKQYLSVLLNMFVF